MNTTADLEQQLLGLPPADRARLLLRAWESLVDETDVATDPSVDSKGLKIAIERDIELTSGAVQRIDDLEFRRRTGPDG